MNKQAPTRATLTGSRPCFTLILLSLLRAANPSPAHSSVHQTQRTDVISTLSLPRRCVRAYIAVVILNLILQLNFVLCKFILTIRHSFQASTGHTRASPSTACDKPSICLVYSSIPSQQWNKNGISKIIRFLPSSEPYKRM